MTNCPNCGAIIFDFAAIEIGKLTWINFKLGDRWVLAHVVLE